MAHRSGCPINLTVELLGDQWSLVILRDMMACNRRTFGELFGRSLEGIATNVLASRLRHMEAAGLITCAPDPSHRQKKVYSLTEKAIQLVPVIVELGIWGVAHTPAAPELKVRAEFLGKGGPDVVARYMDELRFLHLGQPLPAAGPSILAEMDAACNAALGRDREGP
jgi:DNA-binding HxlR family transcriptional regulator